MSRLAIPEVRVSPRHRVRSQAEVVRLLVALALVGVGMLAATWARNTLGGAEEDLVEVYQRVPDPFAEALTGLAVVATVVVPFAVLIVLVIRRRFRQVGALLLGSVGAGAAMRWLTEVLADQGLVARDPTTDRVVEFADPAFATSPLIASAVALVVISSTWLSEQWRRALWAGVAVLMLFRMVSSSEEPLDIVIAFAVGLAAGSLALLIFGTESSDPEAPELLAMVRSVGSPRRIVQRDGVSPLAYDVEVDDGEQLEMRVRTSHDQSSQLLEQLWRSFRLRTWLTDRPHDTVQRRIEHEALAQSEAAAAGVRTAGVRGIVASAHGSVGLVEERVAGTAATDLDPARLDADVLTDMWHQVAALHARRIAHRSLSLDELLVCPDGSVVLRGFDGARLAAPERDLALDRAQLLVSTALVVGPARAIEVAGGVIGRPAVAAAVPFLQPLALPPATRGALRDDPDVLDELRDELRESIGTDLPPLARLDRIRPRTAVSTAVLAAAVYFVVPQLADVGGDMTDAAADANWWWLAPIFVGAGATIASAAVAIIASVAEPISYLPALRMQFAASFVGRIAPANTGSLAVGVRFLQRSGLDAGAAAAGVGLNALVGFLVHLSLMGAFIAWAGAPDLGTEDSGLSLPEPDIVFIVLAVALPASGLVVALVPRLRDRVLPHLVQQLRTAVAALADVLTDPFRVLTLLGGCLGVTSSFILTLAASVAAFGGGVSFPEVGAAYLVAFAIGTVAPTPGGLAAVEFALVAALQFYGMSAGPAVSAVLTFRLATYWAPMVPGWFSFQQMRRREEL